MSSKILFAITALVILVLAVVVITDDALFSDDRNIVLVGYSKYSQKWIDIKEGALSAGQKHDVNITAVACDSIHAVKDQIQLIEQAIDEKPDAIIIMPTDLEELSATLEKVVHNNIDLIIIDNYQQSENIAIPRVNTNEKIMSEDLTKSISDSKSGNIKIGCIFSYDNNGKSAAIYNDFVKSIKEYNNIEIVSETVSAIDENVAGAATEVMINSYDVDYIVCFDETITKGAGEYLSKQIEKQEEHIHYSTQIIGVGSIEECARFLEDEIIHSLGVQSYYNMGYLSVENYSDNMLSDIYAAHYVIQKEDLLSEEYQKVLFRIN